MTYEEFLRSKVVVTPEHGFAIEPGGLTAQKGASRQIPSRSAAPPRSKISAYCELFSTSTSSIFSDQKDIDRHLQDSQQLQ